ncbi:sialidase family protein [uncultured Clostridium sp.]|uniref:sialidase family protein n=1 Tax=uncultured Clostridium sp. TaxID=59620 RepID=UPI0028E37670|nr:sialidase family protein [uncultured Clostridium sp.]
MKKLFANMPPVKKKLSTAILCSTLILAVGATTAFAASANANDKKAVANEKNMVKIENGVARYSTDDGVTWNEGLPSNSDTRYSLDEGKTWNEGLPSEGSGEKSLITHNTPPAEGEGQGLMVNNKNGIMSYSTDGGKTWSENAPDGFQISEDGGKMTIKNTK